MVMKLKNEIWGINVIGDRGINAENDISFGENEDGLPALKLGNKVITEDSEKRESVLLHFTIKERVDQNTWKLNCDKSYEEIVKYINDNVDLKGDIKIEAGDYEFKFIASYAYCYPNIGFTGNIIGFTFYGKVFEGEISVTTDDIVFYLEMKGNTLIPF